MKVNKDNRYTVVFAALGNIFEWYDFIIYASLSSILSKVFFPGHSEFVALFSTFSIFALGFLVRPIGGIILGQLADCYGRKKIFLLSSVLLTLSALAIGLLPRYDEIGIIAPLLLLVFRLIQGFCIGGEYPVIVSYLYECAPLKNRGLISSLVNVTTVLGVLLSTSIVYLINHFVEPRHLVLWGWRLPFLLSAFFLAFLMVARFLLQENFARASQHSFATMVERVRTNYMTLSTLFFVIMGAAVAYYLYNVFDMSYLHHALTLSYSASLIFSMIGAIPLMLFIPLGGWLSDIVGRKVVLRLATGALFVLSLPLYLLFSSGTLIAILTAQIFFAFFLSLYLGSLPAFMAEQSADATRCLFIALAYNLSLALFGGTAPMVSWYLIHHLHTNLAPAFYLSVAAFVSCVALCVRKQVVSQNEVT